MTEHRAGTVTIIGRPNVGKSTLLNQVLGEKVSIISPLPQTTRHVIRGIYNGPDVQAVLLDTPGIHRAWTPLNQILVMAAETALQDVDLVLWMIDAMPLVEQARKGEALQDQGDTIILEKAREAGVPIVLAINKVDAVERPYLLPVIAAWSEWADFAAIVPISARNGSGVADLMKEVCRLLPLAPPLFPPDQLMDSSERFVVSELIREKIYHLTEREIPYATAVEIERFDETDREGANPIVRIHARIVVEKSSQKGIIIGKGGSMLKRIGTLSRVDIERLLGVKVFLELFVAVEENWASDPRKLRRLGYE